MSRRRRTPWSCCATARASGTPRTCSPAGSTSTLSDKGRAEAERGGRLLAEAGRPARRGAHLAAAPRDHARRTSRWTRPTGTGSRCARSWRLNERHYGALQGKDKKADAGGVRRGAVHALAPLLRRAAAAAGRRQRVLPGRRPALRRPAPTRACRAPSAWPTSSPGCCPTGTTRSCPTCGPAARVLVAAHGNSPARAGQAPGRHLATRTSPASTSRPASRCVYRLDADLQPDPAGRASTSTPTPRRRPSQAVANQGR